MAIRRGITMMDMGLQEWGAIAGIVSLAGTVLALGCRMGRRAAARMAKADQDLNDLATLLAKAGSTQGGRADVGFYATEVIARERSYQSYMQFLVVVGLLGSVFLMLFMISMEVTGKAYPPVLTSLVHVKALGVSIMLPVLWYLTTIHRSRRWVRDFAARVENIWLAPIKDRAARKADPPPAETAG